MPVSASPGCRDRHDRSNVGRGFRQRGEDLLGTGACACARDPSSAELLKSECFGGGAVAVEDVLGEDRVVHFAFEGGGGLDPREVEALLQFCPPVECDGAGRGAEEKYPCRSVRKR